MKENLFQIRVRYLQYEEGEAKRLQGTYRANQRGFGFVIIPEEDQDIFMGLGQIMKAKKILLIASGESKAEAIKGVLSGKITTSNPATMLQMHRDVVVIIDEAAAKLVK